MVINITMILLNTPVLHEKYLLHQQPINLTSVTINSSQLDKLSYSEESYDTDKF